MNPASRPPCLTQAMLRRAVRELCVRDADLARAVERFGAPPMWGRSAGFSTLVRIILEQQVSLASARAIYRRLQSTAGRVTAHRLARFEEADFRRAGLTRQKSAFCRTLACWVVEGRLDLAGLVRRADDDARARLVAVPGIGPWTADCYLLMALRRPDVWPPGDLALVRSAQEVLRSRALPDARALERRAATWSPWRSVAARILWHHYLSVRRVRSR